MNTENPISGANSAKFRTFYMQIYFAIPPNSAFHGLLEEFFFSILKIQIFNALAINLLGNIQYPPAVHRVVAGFYANSMIFLGIHNRKGNYFT